MTINYSCRWCQFEVQATISGTDKDVDFLNYVSTKLAEIMRYHREEQHKKGGVKSR